MKKAIKKKIKRKKEQVLVYLISTELLFRIRTHLLRDSIGVENMNFVIGFRIPNTHFVIPTNILDLELAERSVASVVADPISIYECQDYCSIFRIPFVMTSHKHPGTGPGSVNHSHIDKVTHDVWEPIYPLLIGIIFSQDGQYFKFFSSTGKNYRIELIGQGVKENEDNTYCFV